MKVLKPLLAVAVLSALCFPVLRARWAWEKDRVVTLCVDGAELDALFPPEERVPALDRLFSAGVRSVSAAWEGGEPLAPFLDSRAAALPPGMSLTFRPVFRKFSEEGKHSAPADFAAAFSRARYFLPAGTALPTPGGGPLFEAMLSSDLLFPWVEFSKSPALAHLAASFPDRLVRAHSADEDEVLRLSPPAFISRFRRAVRERGARFLYIHFHPGLSPEANLALVEDLSAALRRDGFSWGDAAPRRPSWTAASWVGFRPLAAWLLAILGPLAALRFFLGRSRIWWAPLPLAAIASTGAALLTAVCLSTPDFALGLDFFRGVKAALVIPLLIAAAVLYSPEERRAFFRRPLTTGGALLLAGMGLVFLVYVLRSGHDSPAGVPAAELRLREILEALLGARPRFKEFAVGWPLLWLAARLGSQGRDARLFLLVGLIAPISIINTFCHAHVPLSVSLLRTFHGFWLGALGGVALIFLFPHFVAFFPPGAAPRRR